MRRPAAASPPMGTSSASKRKAARGRDRVDGDVAAPVAQRSEDQLAVVAELAAGRSLAEHVRADEAKRATVGHDPQRHEAADALAELMGVETAERHHAAPAAELVPRPHVALGRMLQRAPRREDEAQQAGNAVHGLAGVVDEAPQLAPRSRVLGVEPRRTACRGPPAFGTARSRPTRDERRSRTRRPRPRPCRCPPHPGPSDRSPRRARRPDSGCAERARPPRPPAAARCRTSPPRRAAWPRACRDR